MSSDSTTLDPSQLAAFRQQAGPILAQERGLTPACRRKLAGVARTLGIAEEQIDVAVRAISAAEPEAPPNPQAERFRRRLRKDLAGKTKTIIGPSIEEQILAKAAVKYGLDQAQAAGVLGEVASELGLTRITAGEVTETLAAQIDEVARDHSWLAREAWDRLRAAGDRWGIEPAVVEALIEERLAANRQALAQRRLRTHLALAGAGVIAVSAIVAAVVFVNQPRSAANGDTAVAAPPVAAPVQPAQPEWWDVPLALDVAKARSDFGGLGGACDLLGSPAAAERAAGYERLISVAAAQPNDAELLTLTGSIAATCLALEPEEVAAGRLQAALLALLPVASTPLASAPPLAISLWSADIAAAALAHSRVTAARKAGLTSALAAALSTAVDPALPADALRRSLRAATTLAEYHRLSAAAAKEPATVAARFAAVTALGEPLPESERLQAETALLAAALPAAGGHAQAYASALGRCISATDPLPALRLLETYRRIREPELSRQLAELLVLRAGVQPKSWTPPDVVAAVRKGLGGAGAAATTTDRWLSLREQAAAALEKSAAASSEARALLEQTALLAQLTTLALALAQGDAGLATFDAAIQQPPQPEPASDAPAPAAGQRTLRALTANETRELARLLDLLNNRTPGRQVPRESALRSLAEMATTLPDVPPRAAELLATYLLAEKSPDEAATAIKRVTELRSWLHLHLAVADGLARSKLTADQQQELVAALTGEPVPPGANLPGELLENVRRELEATIDLRAAASAAGRRDFFDAAAAQLQQTYLTRARLLGASPSALAAVNSPAAALELSLAPLSDGDAAELARLQQALRYLAESDLHLTVAWQRLLIEASARRVQRVHSERSAAARQLAAESLGAAGSAASVLPQLRDQERTLLQLWMLHAPEL